MPTDLQNMSIIMPQGMVTTSAILAGISQDKQKGCKKFQRMIPNVHTNEKPNFK